jgi:hypothetical protein
MFDSDQCVFSHDCTLEAMRTQGDFHSIRAPPGDLKFPRVKRGSFD